MNDESVSGIELISPNAQIADDVQIGHGTRVYPNVIIEKGSKIGDYCSIGHPFGKGAEKPLIIGRESLIRSHSILYEGSSLGPKLETGHHVFIREGTVTGVNLRVGSFSEISGDCSIGDYCRFQSYVHVGKGSKIGNFVWLFSLNITTNDPLPPSSIFRGVTIEDGAVVCVGARLLPGAILRKGAYVSAHALVSGEVPIGGVIDHKGEVVCHVSHLVDLETGTRHPWMRHYSLDFPEDAQERIQKLLEEVMKSRDDVNS